MPKKHRANVEPCPILSIKHPVDGETCYNKGGAAAWLTERGLPTAVNSLSSKRFNKQPPPSFQIGKYVWYRVSALLEYLLSQIKE